MSDEMGRFIPFLVFAVESLNFEVPLSTDMATAEPPKRFNDISQAYIRPTADEDNPEVRGLLHTDCLISPLSPRVVETLCNARGEFLALLIISRH